MSRKVYLIGDLADKFGTSFSVAGDTCRDALRCIDVNRPGFRKYILDCMDNDIAFCFQTEEDSMSLENEQDLLIPIKQGDLTISTVPAGSKSGFAKILAAVVLFTVVGPYLSSLGSTTSMTTVGNTATVTATKSKLLGLTQAQITTAYTSLATNLAIAGIQQIMAPDPAVDEDAPTNYLFSGASQNITEGDPIPVLYGELKVPGMPISILQLTGKRVGKYKMVIDPNNNITPQFTG